jgi:hypothetical protein
MEATRSPARPGVVLALLAFLAFAAIGAAVFVLQGLVVPAGSLVLAVAVALLAAEMWTPRLDAPRLAFAAAVCERIADAAVLGALAWRVLPASPRAGLAALAALSLGYLAAYLRVKATGLGFVLGGGPVLGAARLLAVGAALLGGVVEAGLWVAAGLAGVAGVRRAVEVAVAGEPAVEAG